MLHLTMNVVKFTVLRTVPQRHPLRDATQRDTTQRNATQKENKTTANPLSMQLLHKASVATKLLYV